MRGRSLIKRNRITSSIYISFKFLANIKSEQNERKYYTSWLKRWMPTYPVQSDSRNSYGTCLGIVFHSMFLSFPLLQPSLPSLVNLQTKGLWKTMPGLIYQVSQVFPESDWTVTEHSTFEPTRSQHWLLRNDGWLFVCLFSVIFSLLFWFKFRYIILYYKK